MSTVYNELNSLNVIARYKRDPVYMDQKRCNSHFTLTCCRILRDYSLSVIETCCPAAVLYVNTANLTNIKGIIMSNVFCLLKTNHARFINIAINNIVN